MGQRWELRLYILGMTPTAARALSELKLVCKEHRGSRWRVRVIDLKKNLQLAEKEQIFAVPTLERRLPLPVRRIIGDLSDKQKVLVGLDLTQTHGGRI